MGLALEGNDREGDLKVPFPFGWSLLGSRERLLSRALWYIMNARTMGWWLPGGARPGMGTSDPLALGSWWKMGRSGALRDGSVGKAFGAQA